MYRVELETCMYTYKLSYLIIPSCTNILDLGTRLKI